MILMTKNVYQMSIATLDDKKSKHQEWYFTQESILNHVGKKKILILIDLVSRSSINYHSDMPHHDSDEIQNNVNNNIKTISIYVKISQLHCTKKTTKPQKFFS